MTLLRGSIYVMAGNPNKYWDLQIFPFQTVSSSREILLKKTRKKEWKKERKKERKKNEREFFLPFSFLILSFKKQILFFPKFCLERLFGIYYSTHLQQYVKFTIILNIRWTLNLIAILCTLLHRPAVVQHYYRIFFYLSEN